MVFVLLSFFTILFVLLSKQLFQRWFNHLSIYTLIWFFLLTFYEMKLVHYYDLTFETWCIIIGAFFSYCLGVITYFVAKQNKTEQFPDSANKNLIISTNLFLNNAKVLRVAIIITSLIGLAGAIQNWMVLLHKFKTIQNIIIFAHYIYEMRVQGDLDFMPYLSSFSYVAVFLAGLYTVKRGKLSIYVLLPFLAVVLKELANVARAGMLFALVEFVSVLILYRYSVYGNVFFSRRNNTRRLVISTIFIFILIVGGATAVRSVRGTIESYGSSTPTLDKLKGDLIITPSIYFYFSSDVGVLNKYLQSKGEKTSFGENTFMPVYNILNKLGVVAKPNEYQKGYYIPVWTNTGTYLRELHADFGMTGVLLVPYCLGIFLTFLWFKFFETTNLSYLVIMVYFYIIIFFSFLVMASRLGFWVISFALLLILMPALEKISLFFIKRKQNNLKLED